MTINQQIENFRNNLFKLINSCDLSIGTAYYVYKDVFNTFHQEYIQALSKEAAYPNNDLILTVDGEGKALSIEEAKE